MRTFLPGLVSIAMAVGAGAFGAAPPGEETPAVPQQATAKPAGQAEWGPPAGGLVVSLGLDGEAAAGGRIAFRIRIRSAAGQPVALAAAKDAAGWVVIAQSLGGEKKAVYSRRVAMADLAPDWPAELAADKTLALNPVDLGAGPAWGSDAARELLLAYVSGKAGPDLPKPAGKLSECLAPGRAMARFTLCLPAPGAKPVLVTSGALDFTVSPPNLASMKPESRDAFAADLLKQFDRNPWSGQQAHNTAVRVGKEVLAPIIAAAFETARPGHARLWLATTVADIRDERSADALIKLLDDSMDGVRYVVAYHGPKQESPRLDKAIVQRAAAGKDPGLAAWALMGFMVHRGAVPEEVLRAGLESDDPRARAAVAEALAGHASDFNVSRLVRLLGDANERVRATAAAMLGKSGNRSPPVLAGLVNALDLPGEAARTRICAALSELTGRTAPYDPKADPAARGKTVAGWKQWLAEQPKK